MHADNKQDNQQRAKRTGIKTSKRHCSWRDVYALMGVDPSIEPTSTIDTSSHQRTGQTNENDEDDETGDAAPAEEILVIP